MAGFKKLMQLYQEKLYSVIRRVLIDHDDTNDALQETFIKVWNKVDSFQGDAALFTWVYKIAVNEALQSLRKRKRRFLKSSEYKENFVEMLQSEQVFDGEQIQLILQKAIIELPEKQQLVFNLKYYDELSYEQIAEITGSSIGGLKANYHHAVKKIENYLKSN
ncbi:RNA polymerase subunit sigma-70 [Marivirga lumbricoides]|uniref:RNA polymerase subunit sigma-70 n=1 Tax=Marivirga lumbricoides TaxID=1046115 RepID=A0A2T4DVX5_9BACT|nr:RNA polymerase subunit sigma-70 [Marivirga lumbricoides]